MKFTYYTIIGRDPLLLDGHLKNVTEYAGFNRLKTEKELIVIVYKNPSIPEIITQNILQICQKYNAKPIIYNEPHSNFIENLYNCWNLGYQHSDDGYVFRGGSDQVFSRDSFISLFEEAENIRTNTPDKKFVLQANTIENEARIRQIGANSRHFLANLGDNFQNFNFIEFENFINNINNNINKNILNIDESLQVWGKPTPITCLFGVIDRVDGCSWLMTKQDWKEFGPLPTYHRGITGDVVIHDILQMNGYEEFIVKNCITYHFVRGESMNIQ